MYEEETALVDALSRGEDAAFRQAIKAYQPSMLALARNLIGDRFADEVVQEAWLSAYRAISKFEQRSALKTWLLRITANEAKTRLRKESRLTSLEAMTGEDTSIDSLFKDDGHWASAPAKWESDTPDALLSSEELKACMDEMIDTLPDQQRATLHLRERQGHSLTEICNILEVSESNVRVLLHRARIRLFRCIDHFQETGECCTE